MDCQWYSGAAQDWAHPPVTPLRRLDDNSGCLADMPAVIAIFSASRLRLSISRLALASLISPASRWIMTVSGNPGPASYSCMLGAWCHYGREIITMPMVNLKAATAAAVTLGALGLGAGATIIYLSEIELPEPENQKPPPARFNPLARSDST